MDHEKRISQTPFSANHTEEIITSQTTYNKNGRIKVRISTAFAKNTERSTLKRQIGDHEFPSCKLRQRNHNSFQTSTTS